MPGFNICGEGNKESPSGTVETVRKHRWIFRIYAGDLTSFGTDQVTILAHKAQRPAIEIDSVTFHHSQDEIYMPGKQRWLPIEISFYEQVHNRHATTTDFLYRWWSQNIIDLSLSRISRQRLKSRCQLLLQNGTGDKVYEYMLEGCWPEKITPDELNYDDSTIAEITVRLRMDKAQEISGGA